MMPFETTAGEAQRSSVGPAPLRDFGCEAAQDPIKRAIVKAWETILGVTRVGVDDNFFDLGGNSLSVIRFMSWVLETYQVEIPLTSFFEQPTVSQMALLVANLGKFVRSGIAAEVLPE